MYKNPLDLLIHTMLELRRDLVKSEDMYEAGTISIDIHETHVKNIQPKIDEYQKAINKLIDLP